jgi:hypothetical protein
MLELATAEVSPKLGRPTEAMYFFVQTLGQEWFKMTENAPTRQFNAIDGVETGPFYKFCSAATETVSALLPSTSLDAAVRKVTDKWKLRDGWEPGDFIWRKLPS